MRVRILIAGAILAMLAAAYAAPAGESLDSLRARAATTKGAECAKLCLELSYQVLEAANSAFSSGNVEAGQKLTAESTDWAARAAHASADSHKRQKETEIGLRRLAKRMSDIAHSLNFEDQPPVHESVKRLQDLRDEVLVSMFGNPRKTLEPGGRKR